MQIHSRRLVAPKRRRCTDGSFACSSARYCRRHQLREARVGRQRSTVHRCSPTAPAPLYGTARPVLGLVRANRVFSPTLRGNGAQDVGQRRPPGHFRLATDAPNLAQSKGAALLPMWTACTAAGRFLTTIEGPLRMDAGTSRGDRLAAIARAMIERLETQVLRWPDQISIQPLLAPTGLGTMLDSPEPGAHVPDRDAGRVTAENLGR